MSSVEDSIDSEYEVFFGPVTEKEEQVAAKYRNRLTEVFNMDPCCDVAPRPSLTCLEEKDELGYNSCEGSPIIDVQDLAGQISTGYELSSVGVGGLHHSSPQLLHPTSDSKLENEELFTLISSHKEMQRYSKDGITDVSLRMAVSENQSQKSWEWQSLSDNINLISRADCSHISCDSVLCLHSRSEGDEEPCALGNESVALEKAGESVALVEAGESVGSGDAGESVASGEAGDYFSTSLKAQVCDLKNCSAQNNSNGKVNSSIEEPVKLLPKPVKGLREDDHDILTTTFNLGDSTPEGSANIDDIGIQKRLDAENSLSEVSDEETKDIINESVVSRESIGFLLNSLEKKLREFAESSAVSDSDVESPSRSLGECVSTPARGEKALISTMLAEKEKKELEITVRVSESLLEAAVVESLPEAAVGESLPETAVGERLPEPAVGERLPEAAVGERLLETAVGERLAEAAFYESLPEGVVGESLPGATVGESLTEATDSESLAATGVSESLPEDVVSESLPAAADNDHLPATAVRGSLPEAAYSESLPDAAYSESLPDAAYSESLPEAADRESLPDAAYSESLPEAAYSESLPEAADSESLPEAADSESLPEAADSESLPEAADSESLPEAADSESLPEAADSESLPEAAYSESLPEAAYSESLPEAAYSESLPEAAYSESLPEAAYSESLPEAAYSESLPEAAYSESLPEAAYSESLPEAAYSESLPEAAYSESLPEAAVGGSLPEAAVGGSLPEAAYSESLPEAAVGEGLPEAAVGECLPEAAVGSGLPEAAVGEGLPEAAVGEGLPEAAVGSGLPEAAVGEGLPEAAVGSGLPEAAVGEGLPEAAVGEGLPEAAVGEGLPEAAVGEGLPEAAVGEGLPEAAVGEGLPEAAVGESLPEAAVGECLHEAAVNASLPEVTVSLNDNEIIDQLDDLKRFHKLAMRQGSACRTSDGIDNIMEHTLPGEVMTVKMYPFDVDSAGDFLMEIEAAMAEKSLFGEVEKSLKVRQSYYSALEVINVNCSDVYGDFLAGESLHDIVDHEQCHSYEKSRSSDDLDVESYGSANKAMVISHSDNSPDSDQSSMPHSLSAIVSEGFNVCVSSEESQEYRSPVIENFSLQTPNMPQKSYDTSTDSTQGVQFDSLKFSITSSEERWDYRSPVHEKCSLQTQNTPEKSSDTSTDIMKGVQLDSPKFNDTIEEMEMMLKYGMNYGEAIRNDVVQSDNSTKKCLVGNEHKLQHMVDDSIVDSPRKSSIASTISNFQPVLESTRESPYQEMKKLNAIHSPSKPHNIIKREPPPKPPRNVFSPFLTPKKTTSIKASTPNTPKHTAQSSKEVKGKRIYDRVTPTKKMAPVFNGTPQKLDIDKNKSCTPIKATASKLKSPSTVPRNHIHCSGFTRSGSLTNIRINLKLGQSPVRTPTSRPRLVSRLQPLTPVSRHNTPVAQKCSSGMLGKQPALCPRLPPRPTPKKALKSILKQTPTEGSNLQAQSRVNVASKTPVPAIPRHLRPKPNIESPVAKYLKENPPPALLVNIKPRHKISPQKMQNEFTSNAHQVGCGTYNLQQQSSKVCEDMESSFDKREAVLSNIQDNLNRLEIKMKSNQAGAEKVCMLNQPTPADMEEPCLPPVMYSSAVPVVVDEETNKENERMRRFMEVLTDKQPASVLKHKGRVKVPKVTFQTPPPFSPARGSLMEVSLHESHEAHYTNTLR